MDAFGAQVLAFAAAVPIPEAEQWRIVASLAGMLLPICPVDKDNLRVVVDSLQLAEDPRRYIMKKIDTLKDGGDANWQDWTSIRHFVTDLRVSDWTAVAGAPIETVIQLIVRWAFGMGLRKPNQSTFQVLTCIILIIRDGCAWPAVQKKEVFDAVKTHFKRHLSAHVPEIYIGNLPVPSNLKDLVPDGWWARNLGEIYTDCKFVGYDNIMFEGVRATIPMRNTRTEVRLSNPGLSQLQPRQLMPDMTHDFVQFMRQMMANAADRRLLPQHLALRFQPPQPLALMPPEPAVADDASDRNAAPLALEAPQPAPVQNAAGVHGNEQPMTLQDVAAVLGAQPGAKPGALPVAKTKKTTANKMKRPAAAQTVAKTKKTKKTKANKMKTAHTAKPPVPGWTEAQRRAAYPNGCPKCRNKPLCTPSCFRQRGECE